MNRNIKVKKVSKSKQINQRYQNNSPMKFTFTGMYPKQPPNISFYHFEKKKNQLNKQYYMTGKQNKSKISNNFNQHYHGNMNNNNCNSNINMNNCNNQYINQNNNYLNIQQYDHNNRVLKQKQKRYTHNHIIDIKKSNNLITTNNQSIYHYNNNTTQNSTNHSKQQSKQNKKQQYNNQYNQYNQYNNQKYNYQYNNEKQTQQYNNQYNQHYETIKTVHKSKLRPRQPITLGSMKNNKIKQIKNQKQYHQHHQQQNTINNNKMSNLYNHNINNKNINKSNIKKQPHHNNNIHKTKQSKYIVQEQICDLICTQYLSVPSINHSKVSSTSTLYNNTHSNNYTNHVHETNTTVQMQQSQIIHLNHYNHKDNKDCPDNKDQQPLVIHPIKSILPTRKPPTNQNYRSPKLSSPIIIKKSPQQQLLEFQSLIPQINTNFQHDSLNYMQTKDEQFTKTKNINCYLDNQIHLNWKKRAVVVNWMLEVLSEIGGKREVLANAVNIFDRYLSVTLNIPLDYLQCTAVAALSIAAKLQDKALSAYYLAETTTHKYTPDQIIAEQYKIFQSLHYKVNTPTLNMWSLRLSTQWDMYLQSYPYPHHFQSIFSKIQSIKFKSRDQLVTFIFILFLQSYYNYRWLCQYIDFSIMDINTLSYQPNTLALSFIYLILIMRLNIYTKQQVLAQFPYSSQFLMEKTEFNVFFQLFLKESFGDGYIKSLLPMIQYCATFVILPLNFDLPAAIPQSTMENDQETIDYQSFCSYQTKNVNTLPSLNKRNRTII